MINSLIKKMKKHKNIICFIGLLLLVFLLLKNFKLLEGNKNLTQDEKQNLKKAEYAVQKLATSAAEGLSKGEEENKNDSPVIINVNTGGDTPKGDKEKGSSKSPKSSPAPISDT